MTENLETFVQMSCRKFRETIKEFSRMLAKGGAKDWEDYKYHSGYIQGIEDAEGHLLNTFSEIQQKSKSVNLNKE